MKQCKMSNVCTRLFINFHAHIALLHRCMIVGLFAWNLQIFLHLKWDRCIFCLKKRESEDVECQKCKQCEQTLWQILWLSNLNNHHFNLSLTKYLTSQNSLALFSLPNSFILCKSALNEPNFIEIGGEVVYLNNYQNFLQHHVNGENILIVI